VPPKLTLLVLALLPALRAQPYKNPALGVEERVKDLLGRMSPQEKAEMLSGSAWIESQPIARLDVPAIKMADGPIGVRTWHGPSAVTNNKATVPVTATGRHRHGGNLGCGTGGPRG
jgi:hypothetical protein